MHYACLHILRKPCNQQTQISQIMESRFRHEPACGSKGIGERWAEMFICATPNSPCCASSSKSPGEQRGIALSPLPGNAILQCGDHRNKIALNHNWNQPTKQTANYNISDAKNSRRSPIRPKQTDSNACNGLGAQTHRFSKESKAVRGAGLALE